MRGVHAILGLRGYGKSRLLRALCADEPRLLVIDTLGEHEKLGQVVDIPGLQAALASNPSAFRLLFRPVHYDDMEWAERIAAARPDSCLAVDEIDFWYSDGRSPIGEGLRSIVMYGRHYGQSLIVVARRPFNMARDITSQADLWVLPMREPRDCAYVKSVCGFDPVALRVVEEKGDHIIKTQLARVGSAGTQIGVFDLSSGTFTF